MQELWEDTFFGNKKDDTHEHVERVLDIISLFNIPGVSHDAVMLCVFPITLTGAAKIWEGDETLYQAWERYNDLLYKCPTHDINNHQKVNIFYNSLGALNRQLLDSQGPIPGMTLVQALTAIQTMADHFEKWHNGASSRNIENSSNSEGIAAIVNKLKNLDGPLKEEVKSIEEGKYGEFRRHSPFSNAAKYRVGPPGYNTLMDNRPPVGEKRPSLEELMNKHLEESTRRRTEME
ncbi:hypothetical protein Tco_1266271 [Tanacetum coccineum]